MFCSVLFSVLVSFPVRLPRHKDILILPFNGKPHPMEKRLQMIGALVSGRASRIKDFQMKLSSQCSIVGDQVPENNTNLLGQDGHIDVISGTAVPFVHLKRIW